MVFLQLYLYSKANKEMKKVKEEIGWKKEFENKKYIEIKNLDKKDYDNKINMKWFIIAFLIAILSLIITIVKLKSLPDLVPVHFNFNGDVDRYADIRTLGGKIEIFLIPIMSMFIIFIMYISTFIEYKKRKNIKLNGGTYEQIREIENTNFKSINDMMSGISIFIAVLMLCITFTMTGIIKSNKLGLNITMIITIIMVIYIIIYTIYLMIQNKNINKDYNSKSPEYYIDDDDEFKWGIFYYNPNIYPEDEFQKRLKEQQRLIKEMKLDINIIEGIYEYDTYLKSIQGLEKNGERSKRCYNCYELRIMRTFEYAKKYHFDYYTTTLSISPYKNSEWINEIGFQYQNQNCKYLYSNFK